MFSDNEAGVLAKHPDKTVRGRTEIRIVVYKDKRKSRKTGVQD